MAKILLVEDVEILRTVLHRFLESAGHAVTECAGGDEAARIAAFQPFDVIVTDLWMREGDGVKFIRAQSRDSRCGPVIAMTGGDPSVTRTQSTELAMQAGAACVLHKPVTKTALLGAIEAALKAKV